MTKVIVAHHCADYDVWYTAFTQHGEVRRSHGATGHTIHRGVADPNQLVIINTFADEAGARAFMTDPGLPDVMARAGVDAAPTIFLVEEAEDETY